MPPDSEVIPAALAAGHRMVDRACRLGADEAEAYLGFDQTWSVRGQGRRLLWLRHAETRGLGLRAVRDGAVGYAYLSLADDDLDDAAVRDLTEEALATAAVTGSRARRRPALPVPDREPPQVADLFRPAVAGWDPRRARAALSDIAEAALAVPGIRDVPRSHYGLENSVVAVVSSGGAESAYRRALHYAWAEVFGDDGEHTQPGSHAVWSRTRAALPAAEVGARAAEVALGFRGARPAPTGRSPVVIAPTAAVNLLNRLAIVLSADSVRRGRSLVSGPGAGLGSAALTIVDDPTIPGGLASRPSDGEGIASRRRVLVDHGRVVGLLHDSETATATGTAPSGNATRSSYRALPRPGSSNLFVEPGQSQPEDLIRRAGDGLYVTEMIGLHGTNPASGRFSVAVRGHLIRDGVLARPVTDSVVAGSYAQLLGGLLDVGADLEFPPSRGGCGSPTLLIADLAVVGAAGGAR